MDNYQFGQTVYVEYRGLIKKGVYRGLEREDGEKYHAVDVPSISKTHLLREDSQVSDSKHDLNPQEQSFSHNIRTKNNNNQ